MEAESQEGIAAELTAAVVGDTEVLPELLEPWPVEEPLASGAADGAYDTQACHDVLLNRRALALIPPRAGAAAWPPLAEGRTHPCTARVEYLRQHGGKG